MDERHADRPPAGAGPPRPAWWPRLEILLTALLFSTGGAAVKACQLTSWQVASFRSGVAALALWLLLPATRRRPRARVLAVAVSYAATLTLYVLANKLTTAANTIFLQSTAPLYVLLLAPWLLEERIRRLDLVYMAVLAAGMGLFFTGVEPPRVTAPDPLAGNLLAALSGVTWALTIVGLRFLGRGGEGGEAGEGAQAAVLGNALTFLVALPLALPVTAGRATDGAVVLYLGLFQVGVAYVLLTRALRAVGALEASLLLLLEPVLNPVWAWWVNGEAPSPPSLAGGLVILAATAAKTGLDGRRRQVRSLPGRSRDGREAAGGGGT